MLHILTKKNTGLAPYSCLDEVYQLFVIKELALAIFCKIISQVPDFSVIYWHITNGQLRDNFDN